MRTSWPHFAAGELRCKCRFADCPKDGMHAAFMARLEALRRGFGRPMYLNSAYRCPRHNAAVSSTGLAGPHTTGHAVDVRISRGEALALLELALAHGFTGIGVQQKGPHGRRFLHLDDLEAPDYPRPWIWSY